jgi:2'-5' RNA ligase
VSDESKKYALWLRPSGDVAFSLQQHIRKLSSRYGSPVFEPHVTLLSGLTGSEEELIQMTKLLASSLHPFDVVLTRAGYRDTYFQSLFVHVQPGEELLRARDTAERLFDHEPDESFMPHLSLLYGDFRREEKERMLNSMGREFHMRFNVHSVLLIQTQGLPDGWTNSYSAEFIRPGDSNLRS